MSRDFSSKGGRDGGKRRKFDQKHHKSRADESGAEGADGVDAWSKDSLSDFAADQTLLQQKRAEEAAHREAAAAAAAVAATAVAESAAPAAESSASASASPASASASAPSAAPSAFAREVDGSLLEGGGQVLRNAMAYSALLGASMRVSQIRAGRPRGGGLKAQHLKGLQLVAEMTGGALCDAQLGSRQIDFAPGPGDLAQLRQPRADGDESGRVPLCFEADTQTAGATGLLIQVALPVALFLSAPVRLKLSGGTNATMAPVLDYSTLVFAPTMKRALGVDIDFRLVQRGFFPRGGGTILVHTQPVESLPPINLTRRGRIVRISGEALVTHRLPVHIAQRLADSATKVLRRDSAMRAVDFQIRPVQCSPEEAPIGDGVSLILVAHTDTGCLLAASCVGERGLPAEEMAAKCAAQLEANMDAGGCVDEYMQDQLIIFMALAEGTSTIKTGPLTLHTRTCLHWAQYFTGCKVSVAAAKGNSSWHDPEPTDTKDTFLIRIEGCGYHSRFRNEL